MFFNVLSHQKCPPDSHCGNYTGRYTQQQQQQQQQQHLPWISAVLVIDQWEDERISRNESVCLTGQDSDINLPCLCVLHHNVLLSTWRPRPEICTLTEKDSFCVVCMCTSEKQWTFKVKSELSSLSCKEIWTIMIRELLYRFFHFSKGVVHCWQFKTVPLQCTFARTHCAGISLGKWKLAG